MVYKKYIKRNGKIYGPYVYHSRRVGGKVISEYHGLKKEKNPNKKLILTIGAIVLLLLAFWIIFFSIKFSGRVVLDISNDYTQGEPIKGSINLNLQAGELIPSNSEIIITNNGTTQEYSLKDLLATEKTEQGQYYLKDSNINGEGEGFGIPGKKEKIPILKFKFKIIDSISGTQSSNEETNTTSDNESQSDEESNSTESTSNETSSGEEEQEAPPEENATEETSSEGEEETNNETTITGNAVSNSPQTTSKLKKFFSFLTGRATDEDLRTGQVSKGDDFLYEVGEGKSIEIVEVTKDNETLSNDVLSYEIVNGILKVTTDYTEDEEGFGEDFLSKDEKVLKINFEDLNKPIEEGPIKVQINYQNQTLISYESKIAPKKQKIEIVVDETPIDSFNITLSKEEKQILKKEFKLVIVKTTSYKYRDKILIKFQLGDKSMTNVYDNSLGEESIRKLMSRDRDLWLKDLARELNASNLEKEKITTYDENYGII